MKKLVTRRQQVTALSVMTLVRRLSKESDTRSPALMLDGSSLAFTSSVKKEDSTRRVSMQCHSTFRDNPETYMARLTNRQWRLVVSALSESGNPECEALANDLLSYVLPPCANFQSDTKGVDKSD